MLIRKLSDNFAEMNSGVPYLCWASDGDSTRRQIFDSLMRTRLSRSSDIYHIISKLRMIDMMVGELEETVDYDAKHLSKRFRNYFIGNNIMIGSSRLYAVDVKKILEASPYKPRHSVDELMNPKDKQNVSLATEFLIMFRDSVLDSDISSINFRLGNLAPILKEICHVIDGILCIYSYVTYGIEDQLKAVSKASHTLLMLYRKYLSVIPNVLYHDLQGTFQNIFFCAAKYKIHHPHFPLFLMLLGTDVLERFFGNMRLKLKSGFDNLDLIFCSRAMEEVDRILENHPTWVSSTGKVMRRLALDYSKTSNWDVTKLCLDGVDIKAAWESGRFHVENSPLFSNELDIVDLVTSKVTMLRPFGKRKIGVRPLKNASATNESNEVEDDDDGDEYEEDDENDDNDGDVETVDGAGDGNGDNDNDNNEAVQAEASEASSVIDYVQEPSQTKTSDCQICVDDTWFYKASVVRQTFNGTSSSNDRLKRVEGLSKFCNGTNSAAKNVDNIVMQNDPILYKSTLALVQKLMVGGKETKYIDGDALHDKNVSLVLQKLKLDLDGELYFATGETSGKEIKAIGEHCRMIQPQLVEGKLAFNKSLVFDLAVDMQQTSGSSSSGARASATKDESKKPCKICKKNIPLKRMRTHIGRHIIRREVPDDCNRCGWCGSTQCYPTTLVKTTKKAGIWHYKPSSKCEYQQFLHRKPAKANRDNPCSNWVEWCKVCGGELWKYNMPAHYAEKHSSHENYKIDQDEVRLMSIN